MAKDKRDREDLMLEGTQMPIRGRCLINGHEAFVGFRSSGQPSLYWNQDPVFQFDSQCSLRRVFFISKRYLAVDGELMVLSESDGGGRLRLQRSHITTSERREILGQLERCRQMIDQSFIDRTAWEIIGDTQRGFEDRTKAFLSKIKEPIRVASGPSAG